MYLPVIMLVEFIMALGITFIVSAAAVYFRDLEYILGILQMLWMYLTPVIYSVDMIPEKYRPVFALNPMTPIIVAYRDILYNKQIPQMDTLVQCVVVGILVLIAGFFLFGRLKRNFAEEL